MQYPFICYFYSLVLNTSSGADGRIRTKVNLKVERHVSIPTNSLVELTDVPTNFNYAHKGRRKKRSGTLGVHFMVTVGTPHDNSSSSGYRNESARFLSRWILSSRL